MEELYAILEGGHGLIMLPGTAFDEVYPDILVGEASIAKNKDRLGRIGVTHVLNTAEGRTGFHVQTGPAFYGDQLEYFGIEATDADNFSLRPLFDQCSDFIEAALAKQGKILVHCRQGVSRSATIVLAFLMARRGMPLKEALKTVHDERNVCPNDGFLNQLIEYEAELQALK